MSCTATGCQVSSLLGFLCFASQHWPSWPHWASLSINETTCCQTFRHSSSSREIIISCLTQLTLALLCPPVFCIFMSVILHKEIISCPRQGLAPGWKEQLSVIIEMTNALPSGVSRCESCSRLSRTNQHSSINGVTYTWYNISIIVSIIQTGGVGQAGRSNDSKYWLHNKYCNHNLTI